MAGTLTGGLWALFGTVGALIFYGRFYVQWIVSERRKRSVIPTVFWYMSSVGSVMLLAYAVASQSPLGALGQTFNIGVYSRNLVHIWREQGKLTRRRNVLVHGAVAVVVLVSVVLLALTWTREVALTRAAAPGEAAEVWIWLAVGVLGQLFFALRFLVQWLATEIKRKSVVPPAFWYLSLVAALLQMAAFLQRHEWIFAAGMAATIVIYARNIWLIQVERQAAGTPVKEGEQA
jgi:lipid-A-disaccharide synthase-like uncharacterized protein